MPSPASARRADERWFLANGLPSVLVTRRARWRALWPRSAPALASYAAFMLARLVIFLLIGNVDVDIDRRADHRRVGRARRARRLHPVRRSHRMAGDAATRAPCSASVRRPSRPPWSRGTDPSTAMRSMSPFAAARSACRSAADGAGLGLGAGLGASAGGLAARGDRPGDAGRSARGAADRVWCSSTRRGLADGVDCHPRPPVVGAGVSRDDRRGVSYLEHAGEGAPDHRVADRAAEPGTGAGPQRTTQCDLRIGLSHNWFKC